MTANSSLIGQASLDVITLVNSSWRLVQLHRHTQRRQEDMETATRRAASDRERLLSSAAKQRAELEARDRAVAEAREHERQASELVEASSRQLKAAKEEVRKLMSVLLQVRDYHAANTGRVILLLQREAKYSHEIRRAEQESAKLKERLVKVLMEKGEGKGVGVATLAVTGAVPGGRGARAQWNTEQSAARREEDLVRRVMEETARREAAAAEITGRVEAALASLAAAVRESLLELEVSPREVAGCGAELGTRGAGLGQQVEALVTLLRDTVRTLKKPSEAVLSQEKMALYEEKLVLYEQIIVNFESSKEKQDWILEELKNLHKVSKDNLLQEKCQLYESQQQLERQKLELADEHSKLEELRAELLRETVGVAESGGPALVLPPAPAAAPGLPSWAVQVGTPTKL